jgi:hypothetical protein
MRFMKFSILVISLLFSVTNFSCCHAQQVISDEQAINSLRHFYVNYITYKWESKKGLVKFDSLLRQYSTPRLTEQLKGQDEQDYDFFLSMNGCDIVWIKTLKVTKDITANDIYEVSWAIPNYPGKPKKNEIIKIKLQLIKTPTDILIDRIIM